MTDAIKPALISATTIRIIAVQLLFFGLLFLPEYSLFPLKFAMSDYSIVMRTFEEVIDNPYFYGLLVVIAIVMLFSLDMNVEEIVIENHNISFGRIFLKSLQKIMVVYSVLIIVSFFFLFYKLRFMGQIYINDFITNGVM